MPPILFDPPNGNFRQKGGMSPKQREEYLALCQKLIHPEANQNSLLIAKKIIRHIEYVVVDFIATFPEEEQDVLFSDLRIIIQGGLKTGDSNPFRRMNIVALQLSVLFTIQDQKHTTLSENEYKQAFIDTDTLYEELLGLDWMNYDTVVEYITNLPDDSYVDKRIQHLLNGPDDPVRMIPMIGFVRLSEIVDSMLHGVHYIGLSFKTEKVDGVDMVPISYLDHDLFHYEQFTGGCGRLSTLLQTFKGFQEFMIRSEQDKSVIYSIYFIIFFILHEEPYCYPIQKRNTTNNPLQDGATVESITDYILKYVGKELEQIDIFGLAIPPSFREMINTKQLSEDSVKKYVTLSAERYVEMWRKFRESTKKGGKRSVIHRKTSKHSRRHRRIFATRRVRKN